MKLKPKKWEEFQHYKNRCPPWIKLQKSLLDDYEFHGLHVASRALAPMLWLLASESNDGSFDAGIDRLAFRLRSDKKELSAALKELIDKGFFIVASDALAECKSDAMPEREREGEGEAEKALVNDDAVDQPAKKDCPHDSIIALYHETLPALPRVAVWDERRKTYLRSRWREDPERQSLDWWRRWFGYVGKSDFLMGRVESKDRKPFQANLEWMLKPSNFVKILEGNYES